MKWVRHVQGFPSVLVTFASLIQACKSHQYLSERAEPFPTGSGKIPPAMQGEVSVPCLDQDCGNRAGAGAHVVGGLLHVYVLQMHARASMHARIRCTHVID